jgi:hypothetical protein
MYALKMNKTVRRQRQKYFHSVKFRKTINVL